MVFYMFPIVSMSYEVLNAFVEGPYVNMRADGAVYQEYLICKDGCKLTRLDVL